MEGTVLIFVNV